MKIKIGATGSGITKPGTKLAATTARANMSAMTGKTAAHGDADQKTVAGITTVGRIVVETMTITDLLTGIDAAKRIAGITTVGRIIGETMTITDLLTGIDAAKRIAVTNNEIRAVMTGVNRTTRNVDNRQADRPQRTNAAEVINVAVKPNKETRSNGTRKIAAQRTKMTVAVLPRMNPANLPDQIPAVVANMASGDNRHQAVLISRANRLATGNKG
ncbi:MAG: hypothetical protein OEZ10_01430 [Gammaproteobacteria bacterium]|nr:hypothetical protein [Gammaproteobacteria bacterium]